MRLPARLPLAANSEGGSRETPGACGGVRPWPHLDSGLLASGPQESIFPWFGHHPPPAPNLWNFVTAAPGNSESHLTDSLSVCGPCINMVSTYTLGGARTPTIDTRVGSSLQFYSGRGAVRLRVFLLFGEQGSCTEALGTPRRVTSHGKAQQPHWKTQHNAAHAVAPNQSCLDTRKVTHAQDSSWRCRLSHWSRMRIRAHPGVHSPGCLNGLHPHSVEIPS